MMTTKMTIPSTMIKTMNTTTTTMMTGVICAGKVVTGLVLLLTGVTVVVPPVEYHTTWHVTKSTDCESESVQGLIL